MLLLFAPQLPQRFHRRRRPVSTLPPSDILTLC
jgi:hypothetical protein